MNISEEIIEAIVNTYSEIRGHTDTVYLAYLGIKLKERHITLPEIKLGKIIEMTGKLYVEHVGKTAIVREGDGVKHVVHGLKNIRRSLVHAFCWKTEECQRIFFNLKFPYDFTVSSNDAIDGYAEIQSCYKRNVSINNMGDDEASDLFNAIMRWKDDNKIDSSIVFFRQGIKQKTSEAAFNNSALKRLYDAQEEGLRKKIVIPFDIAIILSERM